MRGVQGGDENIRKLRTYLDALKAEQRALPAFNMTPNLKTIAEACGFDRGVFYGKNSLAKVLVDEAASQLGLDDGRPIAETAFDEFRMRNEAKSQSDSRTKALEEEVIRLRAENARLKIENERYRAIRQMMAETGRAP